VARVFVCTFLSFFLCVPPKKTPPQMDTKTSKRTHDQVEACTHGRPCEGCGARTRKVVQVSGCSLSDPPEPGDRVPRIVSWWLCANCNVCEICGACSLEQDTPPPFIYRDCLTKLRAACADCAEWCDDCNRARPTAEVKAHSDGRSTCGRHAHTCDNCSAELRIDTLVETDVPGEFFCHKCAWDCEDYGCGLHLCHVWPRGRCWRDAPGACTSCGVEWAAPRDSDHAHTLFRAGETDADWLCVKCAEK